MGMFVHLTSATNGRSLLRSGVKANQVYTIGADHNWVELPRAVYCMPVTRDFFATHQWVRELKRGGSRTIVAAYFKLGSDEQVWYGRYNQPHQLTTAAAAARLVMEAADRQGLEVILPRAVAASEIHALRDVPQVVGWRYFPGAHERPVTCVCRMCLPKGAIKSRRLRDRLDPDGIEY